MQLLLESGQTLPNYQGIVIPNSMGICLIVGSLSAAAIMTFASFLEIEMVSRFFLFPSIVGMAGIIDDFAGNRNSKGFKGHIGNLIKGRLTTGSLKAIIGLIVSSSVSLNISTNMTDIILNTMIISLSANLLNLLDTRPVRSIKGYLIILICLIFADYFIVENFIILGAITAYLPVEINEQGMMGDSGSNFLGTIAGINLVLISKSLYVRILIFVIVLVLNLISEKYSFSSIIEHNPILRYIDNIGRKKDRLDLQQDDNML